MYYAIMLTWYKYFVTKNRITHADLTRWRRIYLIKYNIEIIFILFNSRPGEHMALLRSYGGGALQGFHYVRRENNKK